MLFRSPIMTVLRENNIQIAQDTIVMFSDSSWNDCIYPGRRTCGYIALSQRGAVDYGSHLPVPVAMSSGEAEYISAAVACMRASHLRMLVYDLKFLGSITYDADNLTYEPARVIIDKEGCYCNG